MHRKKATLGREACCQWALVLFIIDVRQFSAYSVDLEQIMPFKILNDAHRKAIWDNERLSVYANYCF